MRIRKNVTKMFSFEDKRRFGFPFEIISSTVSFAGRTQSGDAAATAKKSAKFPISIGILLGYGASNMFCYFRAWKGVMLGLSIKVR